MNLKIVGGLWCALCAGTSIYLFVKKSKKDDAMYDRALARGSIAGKSYNQIMDEDIQDRSETLKREMGFYNPNTTPEEKFKILKVVWNKMYKEI